MSFIHSFRCMSYIRRYVYSACSVMGIWRFLSCSSVICISILVLHFSFIHSQLFLIFTVFILWDYLAGYLVALSQLAFYLVLLQFIVTELDMGWFACTYLTCFCWIAPLQIWQKPWLEHKYHGHILRWTAAILPQCTSSSLYLCTRPWLKVDAAFLTWQFWQS